MKRTLIIAAALLPLAACGSVGDREEAASAVATRLLAAAASQDGVRACATLAPDTTAELEESAGKPCPEAILDEDLPEPGRLIGTAVYGQWAQVRLADDTLFLAVFRDGWRVVAAGCTPRGDRPYDCTLQGS
ncbi:hypothetical protein ACTOB_005505 [Actinoplanes oblitus]|uniref:Lipoprotein n=1 Tax=Actinoplanes oblitus TaxID=3040509 RepID=A0ABY8WCT6_9ACTN|nr:hypothetical protein [Actinoplanes oblitus]WIM93525.1 hypothetical protein ACTOB_005505 [Actinoplanes oblitus]